MSTLKIYSWSEGNTLIYSWVQVVCYYWVIALLQILLKHYRAVFLKSRYCTVTIPLGKLLIKIQFTSSSAFDHIITK